MLSSFLLFLFGSILVFLFPHRICFATLGQFKVLVRKQHGPMVPLSLYRKIHLLALCALVEDVQVRVGFGVKQGPV